MPQSPKSNRHGPGQAARGNSGRVPDKNPDRMKNTCNECSYYGGDHAPNCSKKKK